MNIINIKDYISTIESGKRPKGGAINSGVPSLGAEHINLNGGFNLNNDKLKYVPEEYFKSLSKGIINNNDIIVVKDGATTGKVAYVDEKFIFKNACINEHLFLLRTKKGLLPKYLFYYLFSDIGKKEILKDFRGATVGGITKEFLDIKMNLPNLQIQEQIINILDKAQELIDKRKKQTEALDELVKSKFIDMFGDIATNKKNFEKIKIGEVIDSSIKKAHKLYNDEDEISYIDISCIDNLSNKIISYNKYLFSQAPSRAQQCIQKGDILISTVRPNLKNIAMVEKLYENMVTTSGVTVLRSSKINKYFLYKYVLTDYFTSEMISKTSGANYPSIKASDIYNHEMIYPPIELQNKFANFVEQVDKLKTEMEKSLKELEDNFNSLMQRAFKGELFN